MKNLSYILVLLLAFILGSCKTTSYTPKTYKKAQLSFGSGGGFTGAVNEYTLLSNGQLFRSVGEDYIQTAQLDKNETEQFFKNYELLKMDKKIMNDPGNQYFYIKRKTADSYNKATWGGLQDVDHRIKIYYANMMRVARNTNKNVTKTK